MRQKIKLLVVILISATILGCTTSTKLPNGVHPAVTTAVPLNQLEGYRYYSPAVKQLLSQARTLSQQHLAYRFGGANPHSGGMDCSGVIYYLLKCAGVNDVPRQAYQMYLWSIKHGKFHRVTTRKLNSSQFAALKPGDLLFWSGTYKGAPPISHVMIYLGKNKHQQPLVFGSDNGFPYHGKMMWGVSVYDFILPNAASAGKFVGYSCIPHLTC